MNKSEEFTVIEDEIGYDIIPSNEVTPEHTVVKIGTLKECQEISTIHRNREIYNELTKENPKQKERYDE